MFSIGSHIHMLKDRIRMEAFRNAILQSVKKGDIVIDIGTGTGILAFFALQAGAGKVYAIEKAPIMDVAVMNAKENGFTDQIEFIHEDSFKAEIPEKADVIITETIGCMGIDEGIVDILADARKRFLKPGGIIIPEAVTIYFVPVSLYDTHPFKFLRDSFQEIDFKPLIKLAENNTFNVDPVSLNDAIFLSQISELCTIYSQNCSALKFPFKMNSNCRIENDGPLHGTAVFLEAILYKDISITFFENNRFIPLHWNITFFPVSKSPLLSKGDMMSFDLILTRKNGFVWKNGIERNGKKQTFAQCSMFGLPSLKHLIHEK